jgi:hypothetical protein
MAINISGRGGQLNYVGVEAPTPPNFTRHNRAPNGNDSQNVRIGDFWLNQELNEMWVLVSLALGIATWIPFGNAVGILSLTPNTGDVVYGDINANVNVQGAVGSGITTSGVESTHTLYIGSTTGEGFLQSLSGNSDIFVYPDDNYNISIVGEAPITVTENPGSNKLTISNTFESIHTLQTTDATPTTLVNIPINASQAITINMLIVAAKSDYTASLSANVQGGARRSSSSGAILVGAPQINQEDDSTTGSPTVFMDVSGNFARVRVVGEVATTYNWKGLLTLITQP